MSASSERPLRARWRTAVMDADSTASASARLCACAVAEYVNDRTGMCYPSASTLAERMGVCERTARRARSELEDAGFIDLERRSGRSPRIWLRFPTPEKPAGVPLTELPEPLPNPPGTPDSSPDTPAAEPENQFQKSAAVNQSRRQTEVEPSPPPPEWNRLLDRARATTKKQQPS
jgi:DNA-binding transcriptional MocR family regulator